MSNGTAENGDDAVRVTRLLGDAAGGDASAARELLPLVYRSLRALAEREMRHERVSHTLQATALVHEAYLRLVGNENLGWDSRGHFYAAAAEAMRRILIEHARRAGAQKLDGAIEALREVDPRAASVVQLRFYAGLSVDETAAALNIGASTVDRDWRYARAWLLRQLREHEETGT
jgi:DNA-directed RNA polymerase specialized sigma24 family protein